MPYVLDYGVDGNVTGAHFVEELPERPTRPQTPYLKLDPPTTPVHSQGSPTPSAGAQPAPLDAMSWTPGQLPPDIYPPGQPRGPARSSQGHRKQPDLVTSARFAQHANNADTHPVLQQRGPSTYQSAPIQQQYPQYYRPQQVQQQQQHPHYLPTAIHHPQPQRAATHNLHQIDPDVRPHFVPPRPAPNPTRSDGLGPPPSDRQAQRAGPAFKTPLPLPQSSPTYPAPLLHAAVQGQPLRYGPPVTVPMVAPHVPAMKPPPPSRPPMTIPAPPGGIKTYAKATEFVKHFAAHFGPGSDECTALEDLILRYNRIDLNDEEFYTAVYRILYRHKALNLVPGFLDFLPPSWEGQDLTWIHKEVQQDVDEQNKVKRQGQHRSPSSTEAELIDQEMQDGEHAASEEEEDEEIKQLPKPTIKLLAPKKKRPINGFSTGHHEANDGTVNPIVLKPVHHPPPPPRSISAEPAQSDHDKSMPDREAAAVVNTTASDAPEQPSPGLVKLKLKVKAGSKPPPAKKMPASSRRKTAPRTRPQRAASVFATKKRKAAEALDTQASSLNGGNNYGSTPASEITHFGPVYATRRSILNRSSRPYIHLPCGSRFAHPGDVKAHARKGNGGRGCGKLGNWNEHPSCQADYIQIHYAHAQDGYVILDQESHDRLESAIQSGLKYAEEHPVPDTTTIDHTSNKGKKVTKRKTVTKKKTTLKSSIPPAEGAEEPNKYEFDFDTEGDADAEGEDVSAEDGDVSMMSAPRPATAAMSHTTDAVQAPVVQVSNPGRVNEKSDGENVAQPPEPEWEWDGTALRAAALGLRKPSRP